MRLARSAAVEAISQGHSCQDGADRASISSKCPGRPSLHGEPVPVIHDHDPGRHALCRGWSGQGLSGSSAIVGADLLDSPSCGGRTDGVLLVRPAAVPPEDLPAAYA